MNNKRIQDLYSHNELMTIIRSQIQRAVYEQLIIKMADAFNGIDFDLPAFVDFRGRIYRCGILHFHERDLSRGLIQFASKANLDNQSQLDDRQMYHLIAATSFHYKKHNTLDSAFHNLEEKIFNEAWGNLLNDNKIFDKFDISGAKNPFQYLGNILSCLYDNKRMIPITQDASASAYQIMSYLLLDFNLAMQTNLLPNKNNEIYDQYSHILIELLEFFKMELKKKELVQIVCDKFDRKIVKSIYMPIIYGKTVQSTASDLYEKLGRFLSRKECYLVATACFHFFKTKYSNMDCLIRLVRDIGWISSSCEHPVIYSSQFCTTVQDSIQMEKISIWVYDAFHKKRRKVTLKASSTNRDRRKTEIATFVNFIHQKDANIATGLVDKLLHIPIYTVHDNFITILEYSHLIPNAYTKAFKELGLPLDII